MEFLWIQEQQAQHISNLLEGIAVCLYNMAGQLMLVQHPSAWSASVTVHFTRLPNGVYIVQAGRRLIAFCWRSNGHIAEGVDSQFRPHDNQAVFPCLVVFLLILVKKR